VYNMYRRRACTLVLFLLKAELRFFHFLEIVTGWLLVPSTAEDPTLLKTGFFRQAREMKIPKEKKIQAVLYVPQGVTGVYLPGPVLEGSHLQHIQHLHW
jgi:hypothetical protein